MNGTEYCILYFIYITGFFPVWHQVDSIFISMLKMLYCYWLSFIFSSCHWMKGWSTPWMGHKSIITLHLLACLWRKPENPEKTHVDKSQMWKPLFFRANYRNNQLSSCTIGTILLIILMWNSHRCVKWLKTVRHTLDALSHEKLRLVQIQRQFVLRNQVISQCDQKSIPKTFHRAGEKYKKISKCLGNYY